LEGRHHGPSPRAAKTLAPPLFILLTTGNCGVTETEALWRSVQVCPGVRVCVCVCVSVYSCQPCDVSCSACTGPAVGDCIDCAVGWWWEIGACVQNCSEGYYGLVFDGQRLCQMYATHSTILPIIFR